MYNLGIVKIEAKTVIRRWSIKLGETGLVVTGVGCYRGVLCKATALIAKSPTAVVSESTKGPTDERQPSMHANYSRYGKK